MVLKRNMLFADRSVRLYSMLLGIGHEVITDTSYSWDGLRRGNRDLCFWQYTLSGRGELRYRDKVYAVNPGEAMLLTVPDDHCYYFPAGSESWEFIHITMNGREIMRLFNELRLKTGFLSEFKENSPVVKKAFSLLHDVEKGRIKSQYAASGVAYEFVMLLLEYSKTVEAGVGGPPDFIQRVHDFCLTNIDKSITVEDMAECAGYSRFHFSRLFKEHMGTSPHYFMNELRIRLAVRLLQTEQLSVKEIAARCGFEDISYFCKIFRKFQKISPNQFRGK
jgi:AraC-like DNA-binding protein